MDGSMSRRSGYTPFPPYHQAQPMSGPQPMSVRVPSQPQPPATQPPQNNLVTTERKMLILEAQNTDQQSRKWRVMNPNGLPFTESPKQYEIVTPAFCGVGIVVEMSRILGLPENRYWTFAGVLKKGPEGDIVKADGERFRRAIIEWRRPEETKRDVCWRCGAVNP